MGVRTTRIRLTMVAAVLASGLAASVASPVHAAADVTIEFTATVATVDDSLGALGGAISPGDTLVGTYTYDLDTPDTNSAPTVGDYRHDRPPYGIRVTGGGFTFETDPSAVDFLVELVNDHGAPEPRDNYVLHSYNNRPLSNGTLVDHISWQLDDESATAIDGVTLPATPPGLSDWQSTVGLTLTGSLPDNEGFDYFIRAHVDVVAISDGSVDTCAEVTMSGDVAGLTAAPASVDLGDRESALVQLFAERSPYEVGSELPVDFDSADVGSTVNGPSADGGVIPAGTYCTFLLHLDPPGSDSLVASGTVTFSAPIAGGVLTDAGLDGSDADHGAASTNYFTGEGRGADDGTSGEDFITISSPNTLTLELTAAAVLDELRVWVPVDGSRLPIVTVRMRADSPRTEGGGTNGYDVLFTNANEFEATAGPVTDILPAGFTYVPGSSSFDEAPIADPAVDPPGTLEWAGPFVVDPLSVSTLSFDVVVANDQSAGVYFNQATAEAVDPDGNLLAVRATGPAAPVEVPPPTVATDPEVTSGSGSVTTDPDTGLVTVSMPRGGRSDLTMSVDVECPDGSAPTAVTLQLGGASLLMAEGPPGTWSATIPAASVTEGDLVVVPTCPEGDVPNTVGTVVLYDPSGVITDATTDEPVEGSIVTLHVVPFAEPDTSSETKDCRTVETRPEESWEQAPAADLGDGVEVDESIDPPTIDPTVNPQTTNNEGRYGWDVAAGCYFIVVAAPGYETRVSPLVGVPPEVTDLDLALTPIVTTTTTSTTTTTVPSTTTTTTTTTTSIPITSTTTTTVPTTTTTVPVSPLCALLRSLLRLPFVGFIIRALMGTSGCAV